MVYASTIEMRLASSTGATTRSNVRSLDGRRMPRPCVARGICLPNRSRILKTHTQTAGSLGLANVRLFVRFVDHR